MDILTHAIIVGLFEMCLSQTVPKSVNDSQIVVGKFMGCDYPFIP